MTDTPNIFRSIAEHILASALAPKEPEAMRPSERKLTGKRIIKRVRRNGREHYLHATKGWKSRRL